MSLITLTTDFGTGSSYVAAMKGALYSVHPQAQAIDLSHEIPPQDVRYTSYFLAASVPYFPDGTRHVVVVDPGVGSDRPILYIEWRGQILVVPDNGCWTGLHDIQPADRIYRLTQQRYWRDEVSNTFHGRDIFAPVAGHLSRGVPPEKMGEPTNSWILLDLPSAKVTETILQGEIVFIDPFGNLISNIPGDEYQKWQNEPARITLGEREITRRVRTYSDVEPGQAVALVSSLNTVEIAVVQGSAATALAAAVGDPVRIEKVNDGNR